MRKLIITFSLPLLFVFSFALNSGAQMIIDRCDDIPQGVKRAYNCELDCHQCPPGVDGCKACDQLEVVFPGIQECRQICPDHGPPR